MERAAYFRAWSGLTIACAAAFFLSRLAEANDGPVMVQGGSIKPAASDAVELVEEDVVIKAGEDPDLSPRFSSQVSVHYVLKNRKNKTVKVATGFPMTNCIYVGDKYADDAMQFKALDGGKEVKIKAITEGSEKAAVCWALFDLVFAPSEKKDLTLSYREPRQQLSEECRAAVRKRRAARDDTVRPERRPGSAREEAEEEEVHRLFRQEAPVEPEDAGRAVLRARQPFQVARQKFLQGHRDA